MAQQFRDNLSHRMASFFTKISTMSIDLPNVQQIIGASASASASASSNANANANSRNDKNKKGRSLTDVLVAAVIGSAMIYNVAITYKMCQTLPSFNTAVMDEHTIKLSELDLSIPEAEKRKTSTLSGGDIFVGGDLAIAAAEYSDVDALDAVKKVVDDERSFPPGCSWKCYMNNNPDIIRGFKWSENALIRHYHKKGKVEGRSCGCEIAVFAGPHDIVSGSFHKIAGVYVNLTSVPWQWATFETDIVKNDGGKHRTLKLAYKKSIEDKFQRKGHNVLLGLDDVDRISASANLKVNLDSELDNIAHELFSIMPPSAIENGQAIIYINYRAPRVDSLKVMWKENFSTQKTFYQFLMSNDLKLFFNDIDVTVLAHKMVKEGFKVKMIDINGISKQFLSVIGCEVMGLRCSTDNTKVLTPITVSSHTFGDEILKELSQLGKVGLDTNFFNMNVTKRQLEDIDILLNRYDCAYLHQLAKSDSVDILDGDALLGRMIECANFVEKNAMTREVLIQEIKNVFLNEVGDLIDNILDGKVIQ